MRTALLAAALIAAPAVAADDKPLVKELPTKDLKLAPPPDDGGVSFGGPAVVASAAELEKNPVLKDAAAEVKKLIDFDKQKLLVFAWSGSGQDKVAVTAEVKDGKTALAVTYTPGRTRDLRQHVKLFAVPKDAELPVKK